MQNLNGIREHAGLLTNPLCLMVFKCEALFH